MKFHVPPPTDSTSSHCPLLYRICHFEAQKFIASLPRVPPSIYSSFFLFLICRIAWKHEVNLVSRYDERWKDTLLKRYARAPSRNKYKLLRSAIPEFNYSFVRVAHLGPRRSPGVGALCIREPETGTYEGSDWVLSKWHLVSQAAN